MWPCGRRFGGGLRFVGSVEGVVFGLGGGAFAKAGVGVVPMVISARYRLGLVRGHCYEVNFVRAEVTVTWRRRYWEREDSPLSAVGL